MGSLGSRPTVPTAQPQVVFVPQAAPTTTTVTPTTTGEGGSPSGDAKDLSQSSSEARASSLLGRGRGRFGTVKTSFKGLLGLSEKSGERKSLLGE